MNEMSTFIVPVTYWILPMRITRTIFQIPSLTVGTLMEPIGTSLFGTLTLISREAAQERFL